MQLFQALLLMTGFWLVRPVQISPPDTDKGEKVKLIIHDPVYPVLVNRLHNPVFRVSVRVDSLTQPMFLRSFAIDLAGTSKLRDFESLTVFYTGREEAFSTHTVFARSGPLRKRMIIRGRQQLGPGIHHFWLSVKTKPRADLDGKFLALCRNLRINRSKVEVRYDGSPVKKRLGLALRQHRDQGVHTYRIPGLVTTNHGTLIAVYDLRYNGSVDLQEDIDVGMSRSTDGGKSWQPMQVIMDLGEWGGRPQEENGIGDPSILVDRRTNAIWVAGIWAHGHPGERNWFASQPGIAPDRTSQLMLTRSEDDGRTWSSLINLTPAIKDSSWYLLLQGPGKGITMSDGTLVFPAQYKDSLQMPHATILYSADHGSTWNLGTGAKSNTTESQVVELSDGSLMLNMRDNRGRGNNGPTGTGARAVALTSDLGKNWSVHPSSGNALPEPVCNASLISHIYNEQGQRKKALVFANPDDHFARRKMTMKVSWDDGQTWPEEFHLLLDEGQGRGYPSLTSIDQNTIGILYEGSQADLVFQRIKTSELFNQ